MNNLEEIRWSLIHEVLRHSGKLEEQFGDVPFLSFCPISKRSYNNEKINEIQEKFGKSAVEFSELIHLMPRVRNFTLIENGDNLLDEFNQFLNTAELIYPHAEEEYKKLPDWVKGQENENEIFEAKDIQLSKKRQNTRAIKAKLLKAGEDASEVLNDLKEIDLQLRENRKQWDIDGRRLEIEEERDKLYATQPENMLVRWGRIKRDVMNATLLSHEASSIEYADYNVNFDNLKKDWVATINFKHDKLIETINSIAGQIKYKKEDKAETSYFSNLKKLVKEIDEIKIPYCIVKIARPWLKKEVFNFNEFPWRWHMNYFHTRSELSNGHINKLEYRGSLPSYITHLVFIKDVIFKPKFKAGRTFFIDVGSLKVPKPFLPYIKNQNNESFLACFICERVPKCPK